MLAMKKEWKSHSGVSFNRDKIFCVEKNETKEAVAAPRQLGVGDNLMTGLEATLASHEWGPNPPSKDNVCIACIALTSSYAR
jgi:hypothetical protein